MAGNTQTGDQDYRTGGNTGENTEFWKWVGHDPHVSYYYPIAPSSDDIKRLEDKLDRLLEGTGNKAWREELDPFTAAVVGFAEEQGNADSAMSVEMRTIYKLVRLLDGV